MNKVTVLGSLNVDTILKINRLPKPGETMQMNSKQNAGGGKGANQAIAAARCGAKTSFIGKIGNDANGAMMLELLKEAEIDTDAITYSASGTGQAFILLQESGENSILVYGGANQELSLEDIDQAQAKIAASDFLITQFETPLAGGEYAFELAKKAGVKTILNPAPAKQVPPEMLSLTDLITPNETEAQALTGIAVKDEVSCQQAAQKLQALGVKNVIIRRKPPMALFLPLRSKQSILPRQEILS